MEVKCEEGFQLEKKIVQSSIVPGKFWNFNRGHMREDEANTLFKCTVHGFHVPYEGFTNVPCSGFTSGLEVVFPLKEWSCRRWVWMDRSTQNPEDLMSERNQSVIY